MRQQPDAQLEEGIGMKTNIQKRTIKNYTSIRLGGHAKQWESSENWRELGNDLPNRVKDDNEGGGVDGKNENKFKLYE